MLLLEEPPKIDEIVAMIPNFHENKLERAYLSPRRGCF